MLGVGSRVASRRAMCSLVDNPRYSFLGQLGIAQCNQGVFDGTWRASGPVSQKYITYDNDDRPLVIAFVLYVDQSSAVL